jgi:hypothetical protein
MATAIRLVHPSGGVKQGYYGFSWTTFFFGIWPALFRGDFLTFLGGFVIIIILAVCTYRIGSVIAAPSRLPARRFTVGSSGGGAVFAFVTQPPAGGIKNAKGWCSYRFGC